jgi:hypothetical protein
VPRAGAAGAGERGGGEGADAPGAALGVGGQVAQRGVAVAVAATQSP